jgi:predicted nucleic acid-binding protein
MSGFLLDTNVVSEMTKATPYPVVAELMATRHDLWLSVIVIHELQYGISILDEGHRRDGLIVWLSQIVDRFNGHILPLDQQSSELAASLRAQARRSGRTLNLPDALIAGTAATHSMTLITRNVRDFCGLDIDIVNPWESP